MERARTGSSAPRSSSSPSSFIPARGQSDQRRGDRARVAPRPAISTFRSPPPTHSSRRRPRASGEALGDRADRGPDPPAPHERTRRSRSSMGVLQAWPASRSSWTRPCTTSSSCAMVKLSLRYGNAESSRPRVRGLRADVRPAVRGDTASAYVLEARPRPRTRTGAALTVKSLVFTLLRTASRLLDTPLQGDVPLHARRVQRRGRVRRYAHGVLQLRLGSAVPAARRRAARRTSSTRSRSAAASCARPVTRSAYGVLASAHAVIQTLRGRPVRFSTLDGSELDPPAFEARLDEGICGAPAASISA